MINESVFYSLRESPSLTRSLSDQIAREIGRMIVADKYPPGELIEDEQTLATRFEVSRASVRDAVKILVGKRLLEVRRGIGTRVRQRKNWSMLDDDVMAWHLDAKPRPEFLRQLLDVRRQLEPEAARWAALNASDEVVAEIESSMSRMEQEKGELIDFVVADATFHRTILHAANNEILNAMEGIIFSALLMSIRLTNSDPRENIDSLPFHRDVANAIAARQPDKAEAAMKILLSDAGDRLFKKLALLE